MPARQPARETTRNRTRRDMKSDAGDEPTRRICGNLTSYKSGYYKRHRPERDGEVDPRLTEEK